MIWKTLENSAITDQLIRDSGVVNEPSSSFLLKVLDDSSVLNSSKESNVPLGVKKGQHKYK